MQDKQKPAVARAVSMDSTTPEPYIRAKSSHRR
jgi:hypothetical protein